MELKPEEIKNIRNELELTREQFAHLLSVSYKTISRWETDGIRSISNSSSDKLIELKKILSSPKAASIIKRALSTNPGIIGIASVAEMLPIIGPILNISVFIAPIIFKVIKELLDDRDSSVSKNDIQS